MVKPNGVYDALDYEQYIDEGANWLFFKETLALCITEGMPGKFLDVGSGLGFFVECCQRYGIPCEGLEGSPFAVEQAARRGIRLNQVDLTCAEPWPFTANEFSVILASQIVEHLPDTAVDWCLQEARRCLVPGGVLIVLSPSAFNQKENGDADHINLYTPRRIKQTIEAHGFLFRKYLNNWPRNIFTRTRAEYFFWRQVCRFIHPDWLSQGASCIAAKPIQ